MIRIFRIDCIIINEKWNAKILLFIHHLSEKSRLVFHNFFFVLYLQKALELIHELNFG